MLDIPFLPCIHDVTSSIPLPLLAIPLPVILAFSFTYRILAPRLATAKQQSYVLSVIASGMMSLGSMRYVCTLWTAGFSGVLHEDQQMAKIITAFFTSYLLADLVVGYIYYPKQIGLLTGWVHHIVYIGITSYLQFTPWCGPFALAAAMEIPTFHLGLSTLSPRFFRHDATFLVLFFLIRILFHSYLIASFLLPSSLSGGLVGIESAREAIGGSIIPGIILLAAMPLHAMWFYGGVIGYLKRRSAKRTQGVRTDTSHAIVDQAPANSTINHQTGEEMEVLVSPTSSSQNTLASPTFIPVDDGQPGYVKKWSFYLPGTPALVATTTITPPETPLLTPASSMAQTGYFFQHINSFPNLPSLSQLHLPTTLINLRDSFGVKSTEHEDDAAAGWLPGKGRDPEIVGEDEDRHRFANAMLARIPSMQSVRRRLTLKRKLSEADLVK